MDDQDQTSPVSTDPSITQIPTNRLSTDPSATQIRAKQPARNATKDGQPTLVAPSTSLSLKDEGQPGPAQPHPTSQLPQPILFYEEDILEEVQVSTRPRSARHPRLWRILVPILTLLLGLAIGMTSLLWYGLSASGPLVIVPSTAQGNLIIEADKDFVTQLVRNDLSSAGLPGQVENVSVDLDHGSKMVITGDDRYSVFGIAALRHFTIHIQPYVQNCMLQIHVLSANLGGISVTGFAQSFQGSINKQLAAKPAGLPGGFTYCTVGVRTEPGGMFITYRATAVTATP